MQVLSCAFVALLAASQVAAQANEELSTMRGVQSGRMLKVEQVNCGHLGGEMCDDGTCKDDYVPVNLGGSSTICRKPEEAAAQLGGDFSGGNSEGRNEGESSSGGSSDENCGHLGGEMCDDGTCKEDYVPVNLGGSSTICRKPEEAAAQLGGDSAGGDNEEPVDEPMETSEPPSDRDCGMGGQPVCSGDQLSGREYECDYGYVGEDGMGDSRMCVPYEDEITSTPTSIGGSPSPTPSPTPTPSPMPTPSPEETMPETETPEPATPAETPVPTSSGGTGSGTGDMMNGHITHFDAMGVPHGGCGVPGNRASDDNGKALPFVALNTNSEFASGANCGRWIEITLQENCDGGFNSQWEPCVGRDFVEDEHTGEVIYGYVMDSCADPNFWCQNDPFHLDLSGAYLTSLDLIGEHFNARIGDWRYMDGTAPGWSMSAPKYMWMEGSRWLDDGMGFFAALIIYNTDDGITGVEMLDEGEWKQASKVTHLGNVWEMPEPSNYRNPAVREFTVRVKSQSGDYYPQSIIPFTCGSQPCVGNQDAA